jgi:hypothetical protein
MYATDHKYVIHWFTILLACEIRERSLMWSEHDLVRSREVAVEFACRINGVPEEPLDCNTSDCFLDCIAWAAARLKASQNQRSRAGVFSPVFVGEPTERDNLRMLWNAQWSDETAVNLCELTESGVRIFTRRTGVAQIHSRVVWEPSNCR